MRLVARLVAMFEARSVARTYEYHDGHRHNNHDADCNEGFGVGVDNDVVGGGGGGGGGEGLDGADDKADVMTKLRTLRVMMLMQILLSCLLDNEGWNLHAGGGGEEILSLLMLQAT